MNSVHRITAARRNMAFQALSGVSDQISSYRAASNAEFDKEEDREKWKHFWRDAIRDNIGHARTLRLHGIEYPQIP